MPDRYTRRIMDHLNDRRYRPADSSELARDLGVPTEQLEEFERSLKQMVEQGQIVLGSAESVSLPPPGREMTGTFRLHPRGFGFLVPDSPVEHGDLFVPNGHTGGAMSGDRVKARVVMERGRTGKGTDPARSPFTGRVIEILQRAEKKFVGNLDRRGSQWLVHLDGKAISEPVLVRDPHVKSAGGAKVGDKVVVELVRYPADDRPGEGVIVEVLGEHGEPDVETAAVMHAFGLPHDFPPNAVYEARDMARHFDDQNPPPDRLDLTREFICTIDPPDAKDYDDAISIQRVAAEGAGRSARGLPANAAWELGVHIADVSHFVRPGGALDKEARKRGNSAYLPRKVVPMLPEMLSNGVCSLQEGVIRYCKSAFMYYDAQGRVVGERFANTVIRSAKRLTYLEAQALIDGDVREAIKHARTEPKYPSDLMRTLRLMDELAKVIRARRLKDGMIVLGLPDVELVFDDSGRVVDAVPEDDAFTHTLIEMFMVEANEALARLFDNLGLAMVRRIHADPPAHDLTELRQFARVAGFNIPMRPSRSELQALLDGVRGKPAQHAVHLAVLQTLSRAEYSPLVIGHFALASEHYTHFTSPIRRYPDLLVHRGLEAVLDAARDLDADHASPAGGARMSDLARHRSAVAARARGDDRLLSEEALYQVSRHCSTTERNAEAAEKDLRTYLVLDLLTQHMGDDYEGTVTGVTGDGVFVQLDRYLVDGFIRSTELFGAGAGAGERWRLNRTTGALVAQRSGKSITIGDRFVVRVANVNPARRTLDLAIVSQIATGGKSIKSQPGHVAPADGQAPAGSLGGPAPAAQHKRPKRQQPPGARKSQKQSTRFKRQRRRR